MSCFYLALFLYEKKTTINRCNAEFRYGRRDTYDDKSFMGGLHLHDVMKCLQEINFA